MRLKLEQYYSTIGPKDKGVSWETAVDWRWDSELVVDTATSRNGIPIRLTDERWSHVIEEHTELAGFRLEVLETLTQPERIVEGLHGALLAVRAIGQGTWLVVVYREAVADGFVITAFLTSNGKFLAKRRQIWP